MRIKSVVQLKPIQLHEGGFIFPFNAFTKIVLDKIHSNNKKCHGIVFQQGDRYGTVGDYSWTIDHEELLELEAKGMIEIIRIAQKKRGPDKKKRKVSSRQAMKM